VYTGGSGSQEGGLENENEEGYGQRVGYYSYQYNRLGGNYSMSEFPQDSNGPLAQRELFWGLCSPASSEFPPDFKVPLDQGGPPSCSPRVPIGGFGGDKDRVQAWHRAAVRSVGKAPIILIHGHGGSANLGRWAMLELRKNLMIEAGYRKELIWAPSYLGRDERFGGQLDLQFPHAHNVGEVREFIDNVCEYLDVEVADIIAHSLGCTLAYSLLRGLGKQTAPWMTSWSWDQPKKWHRVGTFVALAGAFRGLSDQLIGEWVPDGEFMNELLAEELVGGEDETPYGEGEPQAPGPRPHNIRYFCSIAEGDYADNRSPDPSISTSMLEGARHKVYTYEDPDEFDKHERIIKDPQVVRDIKDLLNFVPPVPSVTMLVDTESGDYGSPLTITLDVDPPDKVVSYVANRVTKEVLQGYIVGKIAETIKGTFIGGQTRLTLPTDGMWEVAYNVEGAVETEKRTYWVGTTEKIEAAIDTDNSTPFEGSLEVTATTPRGKLYHSLSGGGQSEATVPLGDALRTVVYGEGWSEGDIVTINRDAVVYFITIDSGGNASDIVSKPFKKR
jgi:pimeloyl-ACP methyl ester carboxylesterase